MDEQDGKFSRTMCIGGVVMCNILGTDKELESDEDEADEESQQYLEHLTKRVSISGYV